jgi:hypothetical protein
MTKTRNGGEESARRNLVRPYARKEAVQTGSANQRRNRGGEEALLTELGRSALQSVEAVSGGATVIVLSGPQERIIAI